MPPASSSLRRTDYVLYFDGNMGGLDIGALVNFRGVTIGSVTNILVRFEGDDVTDIRIPVFIEIEPGRVTESPEFRTTKLYRTWKKQREEMVETGELMQLLIDNGLKAQLVTQSWLPVNFPYNSIFILINQLHWLVVTVNIQKFRLSLPRWKK